MEDSNLDRIVKDMITNFELRYSPGSWERFERKLNIIGKQDSDFDKMVAEKLRRHSIPVQPMSYSRFQERAGLSGRRKFRLAYILLGIAVSLLLLFVALYGPGNIINTHGTSKNEKTEITIAGQEKTKSAIDIVDQGEATASAEINMNKQHLSSPGKSKVSPVSKKSLGMKAKELNFGLAFKYTPYSGTKNPFRFTGTDQGLFSGWKDNNSYIQIIDQYIIVEHLQFLSFDFDIDKINQTVAINENNKANKKSSDPVTFDKTLTDRTPIALDSQIDDQTDIAMNVPQARKKHEYSALLYVGPQLWSVKTPNDQSLNIPGYRNNAFGYIFGAGLSAASGNHELRTAIEYSAIKYSPRKNILSFGNKSYWLEEISFGLINLPVIYNYNIKIGKNMYIYPAVGVAAQIIAKSEYSFIEKVDGKREIEKLAKELINNSDFAQTAYAAKEYRPGVLDGGKTSGNLSLNLNVGLGIKARIADDMSIFAEAGYGRIIYNNSIGPNNDRISAYNLHIGINKTLSL
jgi:hypothetical protein